MGRGGMAEEESSRVSGVCGTSRRMLREVGRCRQLLASTAAGTQLTSFTSTKGGTHFTCFMSTKRWAAAGSCSQQVQQVHSLLAFIGTKVQKFPDAEGSRSAARAGTPGGGGAPERSGRAASGRVHAAGGCGRRALPAAAGIARRSVAANGLTLPPHARMRFRCRYVSTNQTSDAPAKPS